MSHLFIAVLIQSVFGITTHRWWLGAVAATMFFIGREVTQAEYRWIANFGNGRRVNMPWWGSVDLAVWNLKSIGDILLPLLATMLLAYLMTRNRP